METWLLLPPVAFVVLLGAVWLQSVGCDSIALKLEGKEPKGRRKPYACGEDVPDHRAQPDYGQFFGFAFFFTLMHVVALVLATVPVGAPGAVALAVFFLLAAAVGLLVLFRR
jgi:NADH-quinone oxidoreductase subunit A